MWHDGDWNGWDWAAMSLMMVLFWGALIALIVSIWRAGTQRNPTPPQPSPSAQELLAQRFARGDIDADEYTRARELLDPSATSP